MTAMRSLSFTLSSAIPSKTLVPSANAATAAAGLRLVAGPAAGLGVAAVLGAPAGDWRPFTVTGIPLAQEGYNLLTLEAETPLAALPAR